MINDITPGRSVHFFSMNKNSFEIESAIKQRDLFKRYCNGEDVFNEEEIITPTPFVFK
jgi:hypothetical protein